MPRILDQSERQGVCITSSTLNYQGGQIFFELAVITWLSAMSLHFKSSQRYDFELLDSSGTVYWRWSDGRQFAQIDELIVVEPKKPFVLVLEEPSLPLPPAPEKVVTLRGYLVAENMSFVGDLNINLV